MTEDVRRRLRALSDDELDRDVSEVAPVATSDVLVLMLVLVQVLRPFHMRLPPFTHSFHSLTVRMNGRTPAAKEKHQIGVIICFFPCVEAMTARQQVSKTSSG